jgi:hypothetical protein
VPNDTTSVNSKKPVNDMKTRGKIPVKQQAPEEKKYNIGTKHKLSGVDVAATILLFPLMLAGCSSERGVEKTTSELSETEKGGLDALLKDIYGQSLQLRRYATYYDATIYADPVTNKKLDKPIITISAVTSYVSLDKQDPEAKERILDGIAHQDVKWEEDGKTKKLTIIDAYVGYDDASGIGLESIPGAMMEVPHTVVTIYPKKVRIETE